MPRALRTTSITPTPATSGTIATIECRADRKAASMHPPITMSEAAIIQGLSRSMVRNMDAATIDVDAA